MLRFREFLSEAKNYHPTKEGDFLEVPETYRDAIKFLVSELSKEFDMEKPLTIELGGKKPKVFFKLDLDTSVSRAIIQKLLKGNGNRVKEGEEKKYKGGPSGNSWLKVGDVIINPFERKGQKFSDGSLGEKITAADWEQIICVGWNDVVMSAKTKEEAKKMAEITEWKDQLDSKHSAGRRIAETLKGDIEKKKMIHFGSSSENVSQQWMGYVQKMRGITNKQPAASSRTPKTDMYMDGEKIRISLKKRGGSQLMSGKDFETLGTISVALDKCREQNFLDTAVLLKMNKIHKDIEKRIKPDIDSGRGFVTRNFKGLFKNIGGEGGAQSAMKRGDGGWERKNAMKGDPFLDWVIKQTNMQDKIQEGLDSLLTDPKIKKTFSEAMTHEAMTGSVKFGKTSKATATHVLIFQENGENSKFTEVDNTYVADVASKVNWQVKFKTSGTGKSAWSALKGIFKESFDESGGQYLTEHDFLDEGIIWNFIKKWFKKVWDKIVEIATKSIEKLMEIFGINMQFSVSKDYTFV